MDSFQIVDKDNNPISIKQLDVEAAEFWNKKVDPKWYANPSPEGTDVFKQQSNWYDTIGWAIANKGNYTSGWHNVVNDLIAEALGQKFIDFNNKDIVSVAEFKKSGETTLSLPEEVEISIFFCLEYYKPYIQLINHWMTKGYQPKQIKE